MDTNAQEIADIIDKHAVRVQTLMESVSSIHPLNGQELLKVRRECSKEILETCNRHREEAAKVAPQEEHTKTW